ncbi:MAG: Plug domain-containing protein, partial [Pedobacter sp.]
STFAKSKNSISSITFDEEAIERIQAFSLIDILNTLPGKQLVAPDINVAQTLTLRNTLGGTYGLNNSLGIPIIVDGIRLSNDANMQSRPATQWGIGAVVPATNSGSATDVPFRGIDLREIPAESIEKIEVIQGVANAEYGELTDGAIIIERKAGRSPLQFTTNLNAGSYNYSLNKGFNLPRKLGGLTADLNYLSESAD